MNTYTLKIILQSDTLVGAAGGHGSLIDSEVVFDEYGISYIPGKRIKGLLLDSLLEVEDMLKKSKNSLIQDIYTIFGKQGSKHFSRFFVDEDLHLDGYENLMGKMANAKMLPETVKSYFATELSQTAMDEETGAAKEGSLRRIRVLKALLPDGKNLQFQAKIRFPQQFENHIVLACKNLTRMGTIRNRGLGNISTSLHNGAKEALTIKKSKDLISLNSSTESAQDKSGEESKETIETTFTETKEKSHYLEINLQSIQKLLIRANGSDENMVSSLDYIQGSNIMGLMAQKYLEKYTLDENFFKLFLRGYLHFSPALPVDSFHDSHTMPLPLMAYVEKGMLKFNPDKNYKGENKYLTIANDNKVRLIHSKTQLSLHHERKKETGMVDEIMYNYQAISPYQQFRTLIFGNKKNLEIIKGLITDNELVKIGASQTAEYGSCKISASEIKEFDSDDFIKENAAKNKEKVILCLVSDTIIYNDLGYPSLKVEDVRKYLELKNGNTIKPSKLKPIRIENYIKVWKSKKPSDAAIKAGACFELESLPENYEQLLTKGLGERTHEGYGKVFFFYENSKLDIVEEEQTQKSNAESDTYKNLSTWVEDKDLEKEIELLAMEYAEGFEDKNMGSFARQLIQPILQVQNLAGEDSIKKALSPTAWDKINSFDNKEGKSIYNFFKETELVFANTAENSFLSELKKSITSINQVDKKAELKKHFIRTFLTYLNLANKNPANKSKAS